MSGRLAMMILESGLPRRVKFLASTLALFARDDGTCIFPSRGRLAWLMGVSERQVSKQLTLLVESGVLCPITSRRLGRGRSTSYHLNLERISAREPWQKAGTAVLSFEPEKAGTPGPKSGNSRTEKREPQFPRSVRERQRSVRTPLNPPSYEGGRSRPAEKPPTRGERTWAETLLRHSRTGCPHTPSCPNRQICIGQLVADKRANELEGLRRRRTSPVKERHPRLW
jgi:hypothetical protein